MVYTTYLWWNGMVYDCLTNIIVYGSQPGSQSDAPIDDPNLSAIDWWRFSGGMKQPTSLPRSWEDEEKSWNIRQCRDWMQGLNNWLVVWNMSFMTFHILGMSSSQPTFTPSFFRGVGIPPTSSHWTKKPLKWQVVDIFQRGWNHQADQIKNFHVALVLDLPNQDLC